MSYMPPVSSIFFFNDTATTEIYTLSLHDALPICTGANAFMLLTYASGALSGVCRANPIIARALFNDGRSEEHTSELQSHLNLVCRLLLEKNNRSSLCGQADPLRSLAPALPTRSPS